MVVGCAKVLASLSDRFGMTDDRGCPDDEDGDADRGRKDAERAEGSRVYANVRSARVII